MKVIESPKTLVALSSNEKHMLIHMLRICTWPSEHAICKEGSPMWVFGNNLINCLIKGGECVDALPEDGAE